MFEERAMDGRETAETIVEFLVDGGTVALTGRRAPDGTWTFEMVVGESLRRAFLGEDEEGPEPHLPTEPVGTWEEALAVLDCYAWAMCAPKSVHPQFRQAVWSALLERTLNADEYCADFLADRLFEWEDFCVDDPLS
jgi:hypothetical protein